MRWIVVLTLISGCGAKTPPVSAPVFDRVVVPYTIPGDLLFCIEEPFLTKCPMTVEQLRAWINALRRADD